MENLEELIAQKVELQKQIITLKKALKFTSGVRNHWFNEYKRILLENGSVNSTRMDRTLIKIDEERKKIPEKE